MARRLHKGVGNNIPIFHSGSSPELPSHILPVKDQSNMDNLFAEAVRSLSQTRYNYEWSILNHLNCKINIFLSSGINI